MHKLNKAGLAPGSIVFTGDQMVEKVQIHHLQYNQETLLEKKTDNHEDIVIQSSDQLIDWYDIRGLHDTRFIEVIGDVFEIHPLCLENIVDVHQRPKFEEYDKGIFILAKALSFDKTENVVHKEQFSVFFNEDNLISFQETESDLFLSVRRRLEIGKGKVRSRKADYLAFALLDAIVDNYFLVLDEIEETIEALEDTIISNPNNEIKETIHHLKKELLATRKVVAPIRELIRKFSDSDNEIIEERNEIFIRNLYDHIIQVLDFIESYRDMLNGLQDLYLSELSFKMNQVMQVLTIISVIFIPLTFLAGIYGMNFEFIPELKLKYGYFILWGVMLLVLILQLIYFKKKKWF